MLDLLEPKTTYCHAMAKQHSHGMNTSNHHGEVVKHHHQQPHHPTRQSSDEPTLMAGVVLNISPTPFARGTFRDAFLSTAVYPDGRTMCYVVKSLRADVFGSIVGALHQGGGAQQQQQYVVDSGCNKTAMDETVKVHRAAKKLADEFNAELRKRGSCHPPVVFVQPVIHEMTCTFLKDGRPIFREGERVALEPYLSGPYEKFTCNDGAIIRSELKTPQAFTHYTWHKSGGKLIVCDLQGVRQVQRAPGDAYFMTDPAIASVGRHWGPSDAGLSGIFSFFMGHKCNEMCRDWKRPDLKLLAVTVANYEKRRYSHPPPMPTHARSPSTAGTHLQRVILKHT